MKVLLREPLVHFLLLGAVLFGLYAVLRRPSAVAPDEIVITRGEIEDIAAAFARGRQRPPSAEELKGLVDAHLREEIFSREGIKLGLDRNDTVIRQRLEKEMAIIAENSAAVSEPTEAELADFLAKHPELFRREARFSFRQVFLNPKKHGAQLAADASVLLAALRQGGESVEGKSMGDSSVLPFDLADQTQSRIQGQFGEIFVSALARARMGEWTGPVMSAYGSHLVWIYHREEARLPGLDEARTDVMRELGAVRRREVRQAFFTELLAKYRVKIDWPEEFSASETFTASPVAVAP